MANGKDAKGGEERDDADREDAKRHADEKLEEALEGTFPASDPIELRPEPDVEAPDGGDRKEE